MSSFLYITDNVGQTSGQHVLLWIDFSVQCFSCVLSGSTISSRSDTWSYTQVTVFKASYLRLGYIKKHEWNHQRWPTKRNTCHRCGNNYRTGNNTFKEVVLWKKEKEISSRFWTHWKGQMETLPLKNFEVVKMFIAHRRYDKIKVNIACWNSQN